MPETRLDVALTEEANAIHGPGKVPAGLIGKALYRKLNELNSTALCFSGGGIRSASFCLGVLEALARHPRPAPAASSPHGSIASPPASPPDDNSTVASARESLLAQFNYLSTVSGGGYVGSWLSAWLKREHDAGPGGWDRVWEKLAGRRVTPDEEPPQLHWLRTYSNYLTPKLGIASADTWAAIAIFLRNLVLNWLVLVPFLCATLLLFKLLLIAVVWVAHVDPLNYWPAVIFVVLGAVSLVLALRYSNRERPSRGPSEAADGDFIRRALIPGVLAAILFTFAMATPSAERFAHDWLIEIETHGLKFLGIGLLAVSGAILYAVVSLFAGRRRTEDPNTDLFWWTFSGLIAGALIALGIYLYFIVPDGGIWPFKPKEVLLLTFAVPWIILSTLIAEMIFVGFNKDMLGSDADREWLGRAAGWYLVVALVWPVAMCLVYIGAAVADWLYRYVTTWIVGGGAGAVAAILGKSSVTPAKGQATGIKGLSFNVILAIAAAVFAVALIIGLSAGLDRLLVGQPLMQTEPFNTAVAQGAPPPWAGGWWILLALVLSVAVGLFASRRININRFSMHALYRNRIIRGFLGASNATRSQTRNRFTDFDENDNLRCHELWPKPTAGTGPANWRPFHVINMALNVVATKKLEWQERKAESFTTTPLHSGNKDLGFRSSETYGDTRGISLGTAVAISGAAASPNMGYHSSPALALLMTFFNVRLGWWLGNPGPEGENTYARSGPPTAIKPLLYELFGQTTDTADYVYLSDGGHFENLGLYEMVRRRCRYIVAIDAGCDKEFAFEDLGNAVRKIALDLGVTITFDKIDPLCFREKKKTTYGEYQPPFHAVGIIDYPHADDGGKKGIILYVKPAFHTRRLKNVGVRNYATANPDFPHQSTGDQWFSESQLESHRALGLEIADAVLTEVFADPTCPANPTLPQILDMLAK